jgi:hypothetical protein
MRKEIFKRLCCTVYRFDNVPLARFSGYAGKIDPLRIAPVKQIEVYPILSQCE